MPNCPRCGAYLATNDLACRYCGVPHAQAIAQQQADEARRRYETAAQAAEQQQQRARDEEALARLSRTALIWSLVGLPLCCIPIPSIVALVFAVRAHRVAVRRSLHMPANAIASFVLGIVAIVACVALYIFVILDSRALEARRRELRAQVENESSVSELTQPSACALVELWLLENPLNGNSWTTSDHFDCPGKLKRDGEQATLFDVRIRHSRKTALAVTGCLKHGARWMVETVRVDQSCAPESGSPTTASSLAQRNADATTTGPNSQGTGSAAASTERSARPAGRTAPQQMAPQRTAPRPL